MLFIGLGNPGKKYQHTRHNIGFMAVEAIERHYSFSAPRARFLGALAEGRIAEQKAFSFKPHTYMNLSGQAVGEVVRYFDIALEDIVIFYDEIDLPLGKLRVRSGGGAGGHKGVVSCAAHIGENFRRVRLGIGHPGDKALVDGHVLGAFSKTEREDIVEPWLKAIAQHAELLMTGDNDLFANKLHLKMAPPPDNQAKG